VLSLLIVQVFAGVTLAALIGGFVAGHLRPPSSAAGAPVVAAHRSTRSALGAWVGGSLLAAFWSVGVLLAPSWAYDWPGFPGFAGSSLVQVAGFVVSMGGGLLFFSAVRALGKYMTPEIQVRKDHELIQRGPYRSIRHPVYTAIILGAAGSAILYLSLPLGALTVFLVVMATVRARSEERLLSSPEAFGKEYADYVARTGRFVPRIVSRR
jgi:protein-S-isoprenylcysteine O-methyltransferase Ste14